MSTASSKNASGERRRSRGRTHPHTPPAHDANGGSSPDPSTDLKELPVAEVEKQLNSSPDGLTSAEAQTRLARHGPNEIEEEKTSSLRALLAYFWGPIAWMIEIAVVLSAALGHWADFAIILLLLLANAAVGFSEEWSSPGSDDTSWLVVCGWDFLVLRSVDELLGEQLVFSG
jgi:magnesium-transporting ATPase (P-type)